VRAADTAGVPDIPAEALALAPAEAEDGSAVANAAAPDEIEGATVDVLEAATPDGTADARTSALFAAAAGAALGAAHSGGSGRTKAR